MSRPPLRYRLALACLRPLLAAVTLWQAWRARDPRFARQRLGRGFPAAGPRRPLWLHCASVGEVNAARALIAQLRATEALAPVLVSTTTPTGADAVRRLGWDDVRHVYLPLDHPGALRRAFDALRPRALVLVETEIWPNLIHAAAAERGLPLAVVNARLSPRTLEAPSWLRPVYRQALGRLDAVLAKSEADARGFVALGATPARVRTLGNLKFAAAAVEAAAEPRPFDRPFWLAASTHDDEELQLARALHQRPMDAGLLVIAPRHPARSVKIQRQLRELGVAFAVRSLEQPVTAETRVYLADTLGEMQRWLQHAELVFMGGSLVPVGGHNLLEPAAAARPIASGPQLHNFAEEAALLRPSGALAVFEDAAAVVDYAAELRADPARARQLGEAGARALAAQGQVLEDYRRALLTLLEGR